jgi:transcriptional regulator with XRE-family HTH domain
VLWGAPVTALDERKLYQLVGQRIRSLRIQHTPKLTQARLASLLQVERTSVTNIENGTQRPPLALLYRLSVELDVPLAEVLPNPEQVRIRRLSGQLQPQSGIPPKAASVISRLSTTRAKPLSRSRS